MAKATYYGYKHPAERERHLIAKSYSVAKCMLGKAIRNPNTTEEELQAAHRHFNKWADQYQQINHIRQKRINDAHADNARQLLDFTNSEFTVSFD